MYKIGMTRRFEPRDRVDELGNASVPFEFDVHAMIASDNEPALEAALHRAFNEHRVNAVNLRKEFFRVSLDDIATKVKDLHGGEIVFTKVAEAAHYRQTMARRLAGVPIGAPLPPQVETPRPGEVVDVARVGAEDRDQVEDYA